MIMAREEKRQRNIGGKCGVKLKLQRHETISVWEESVTERSRDRKVTRELLGKVEKSNKCQKPKVERR